ncbi:MAG: hypothetical protein JST19_17280 [Bacteroidetes bacterium]|nr:hypothetical protein [Bacteroidota bacterium]
MAYGFKTVNEISGLSESEINLTKLIDKNIKGLLIDAGGDKPAPEELNDPKQ